MPSEVDRDLVVGELEAALYTAGGPTLENAWLGIYQVLLFYDSNISPPVLHVNEANELRKPPWRAKAGVAERYIADALGVQRSDVPDLVDRMMRLPRWQGMQRNNPIGNGLRIVVAEVLRRWGNPALECRQEEPANDWFPGISMPGRSRNPMIDVMMVKGQSPRCVLSCKWSIRHDRISDPTNECQEYSAAAIRRQLPAFSYFVFTNEFSPARLEKVLNQPCVSGLVHVHVPLVKAMNPGGHAIFSDPKFLDLTEFVRATQTW